MSITEVEDLTMFCRVCLQLPEESELLDLNLIYDEEEQLTYYDCFTMCTQIQIGDVEGLPQNLCRSCGLELQMAYDFYKKVEESKRFLTQLQDQQSEAAEEVIEEPTALEVVQEEEATTTLVEEEVVIEQELETEQHEDEQQQQAEEEHLEMEDYQSLEQLDDEDLNYKADVIVKEEEAGADMETVFEEEILVDENDLANYIEYQKADRVQQQTQKPRVELKTDLLEKLSESENEIDEDFTFEDLYDKVFEDIKSERLEEKDVQTDAKKFLAKKRRRGRPRLDRRCEDVDDPDIMLDQMEAHERQTQSLDTMPSSTHKRRRGAPIKTDQNGPPFHCEVCDAQCKTRAQLNSHRFRKHRPVDPDSPFSCTKCNRLFPTQQTLDRHLRRPTCDAYPQFDCEHCGKKCIGLSNYNIHLRFHKRQYPFVCHLCGKKFMMRVHLNEHVAVKHENKRYPCEYEGCGKLFQTRNSLYNHSYAHTGYMPYECEYCKRGYASKSRLRFHCKKSHDIDHTIEELDYMQVTEKLPNPHVKPQ